MLWLGSAAAVVGSSGCSGSGLVNALARTDGVVIERDLAYGPLERHRYDLYTPATADERTPLLLYVHGGSWQDGDKRDYHFLGSAFARAGLEVAVINYRLHPEVIQPGFVEDASKAVAHVKRSHAGGRPLILAGHSAGAHIAALVAGDRRYLEAEGTEACEALAAFIGVAGPYDFTLTDPVLQAIFPERLREDAKPVHHVDPGFPPSLLLHGASDETVPVWRTHQMQAALEARGVPVDVKIYRDVGHVLIVGAIAPLVRNRAPTFADVIDYIEDLSSERHDCL